MSQIKVLAVKGEDARVVEVEASTSGILSLVRPPLEIFAFGSKLVGVCSRYFMDAKERPSRFLPIEGYTDGTGHFVTGPFVILAADNYDESTDDATEFEQFGFRDLTEDERARATRLLEIGDDMQSRYAHLADVLEGEEEPATRVETMLRVLVFEPGKSGYEATIPNTREAFKEIVGDSLCQFSIALRGVTGMCHDDGYRLGLPPNRYNVATRSTIVGTFFVCGVNPPELVSLTPQQMIAVRALYPDKS